MTKRRQTMVPMMKPSALFPILEWLPDDQTRHLKSDLFAGLTVALVLIPQSMAYAPLAGLPSYCGLYAAFLPLAIAALFVARVRSAEIDISLNGVPEAVLPVLKRTRLFTRIGADHFCPSMKNAIRAIHEQTHTGGSEKNCPLTTARTLDSSPSGKGNYPCRSLQFLTVFSVMPKPLSAM